MKPIVWSSFRVAIMASSTKGLAQESDSMVMVLLRVTSTDEDGLDGFSLADSSMQEVKTTDVIINKGLSFLIF